MTKEQLEQAIIEYTGLNTDLLNDLMKDVLIQILKIKLASDDKQITIEEYMRSRKNEAN